MNVYVQIPFASAFEPIVLQMISTKRSNASIDDTQGGQKRMYPTPTVSINFIMEHVAYLFLR